MTSEQEKETIKTTDTATQPDMTIDEAFEKLEELAEKLEDRETSLEDSFLFYKKGMELLKYCSTKLDTVEKKMMQMNEDGTLREFSK